MDRELSERFSVAAEEEMPRVRLTRRQVVAFSIFILSAVAFLYFVLPKLTGVGTTVHRIERGNSWWIAVGVMLETLSFAGYVVLFRAVFLTGSGRIGWRGATRSRWPALAATRLFAAAGAGGIALTAWALRAPGWSPARRLPDGRLHGAALRRLCGLAGDRRFRPGIGLFPGGGPSRSPSCRRSSRLVLFV